MKPRGLKVLRIDDRAIPTEPEMPTAVSKFRHTPPEGIESLVFFAENIKWISIDGWKRAILFWSVFQQNKYPDLVVADVLFDHDVSTPLNYKIESKEVPTGLSHMKPFAALSRALGVPIGLGIHTGNPEIWKKLSEKEEASSAPARMAFLAAHEIGEIAAILGDHIDVPEIPSQKILNSCWEWLEEHTTIDFDQACLNAIEDYRYRMIQCSGWWEKYKKIESRKTRKRKLFTPTLYVLPDKWVQLLSWCDNMKSETILLKENDPGIEFILTNGKKDCIAFSSLFADVTKHDFNSKPLPARCFDTEIKSSDPWKLDNEGLPQIGAFIRSMGSISRAFEEAKRKLKCFPIILSSGIKMKKSLRDIVDDIGYGKLVRGLIVILQILRCDFQNFRLWKRAFKKVEWDPRKFCFDEDIEYEQTLEWWLRRLCKIIGGRKDWFFIDDIFEDYQWDSCDEEIPKSSIIWHFDRLVDINFLHYDDINDRYKRTPKKKLHLPPIPPPSELPNGIEFTGKDIKIYLRDSLGFGEKYGPYKSNDDNVVGQILANAFLSSKDKKEGRAFLNQFLAGDGPPWILELCRCYATDEIRWTDSMWPMYLIISKIK